MVKRPVLFYILAFVLGIFLENINLGIAGIAILFILCEICCFLLKNIKKRKKIIVSQALIILIFCFILFGMFFLKYFNFTREKEVKIYDKKEATVVGIIDSDGEKSGGYWQYQLKNNFINENKVKSKVLLMSKHKLEYGNLIKFNAILEIPKGNTNKNTFSYSKYLKTLNIYITAKADNIYVLEEKKLSFIENISYLIRIKVQKFTSDTLDDTKSGILNALIIGDDRNISSQLEDNYKKAGMLHLLVVSGGHTVFLIMLLKLIFSFFNLSKNLSKILYILVIILYIVITGATASILRAGLGIIIVMISSLIGRQNDSITTMGITAFIILAYNPNILFSLSFLLSFGGVLGIVICYPKVSKILKKLPKIISEPLSLTISAQLFVTPITIYSFNTIYLGGIISNIFTLSLSGIIMMFGIVLFIIYLLIPPLVFLPMKIVEILVFIMNEVANFFGNINWLVLYVCTPNFITIILYYILLLYVFLKKEKKYQKERMLVPISNKLKYFVVREKEQIIILFGIISILIFNIQVIDFDKSLKISVIDVGHGDSILITTPNNKNILIDTGDKYYQNNKVNDMGEKIIIPYLLKNKIKSLDLLVLTHMDSDHIGGFNSIAKVINIKKLLLSVNSSKKEEYINIKDTALKEKIDIKTIKRGDKIKIDDVEIFVLLPQKTKEILNENNDSVVLLMKYKGIKTLFMGDLEKEGEEKLLNLESDLDIDILKIGHHGSSTSSISEFIKKTTPKIALISVGNRFKSIPSKDVLNRFSSVDSRVYRTDENGEINVVIKEGNMFVKTIY